MQVAPYIVYVLHIMYRSMFLHLAYDILHSKILHLHVWVIIIDNVCAPEPPVIACAIVSLYDNVVSILK